MTPPFQNLAERWTITRLLLCLAFPFLVVASGCGSETAPEGDVVTIDRETFISTYVDLRVAALSAEGDTITAEQRATILADHGVAADDLMEFAEVHGEEVFYMREVWNEVEARLDAARERPDTLTR